MSPSLLKQAMPRIRCTSEGILTAWTKPPRASASLTTKQELTPPTLKTSPPFSMPIPPTGTRLHCKLCSIASCSTTYNPQGFRSFLAFTAPSCFSGKITISTSFATKPRSMTLETMRRTTSSPFGNCSANCSRWIRPFHKAKMKRSARIAASPPSAGNDFPARGRISHYCIPLIWRSAASIFRTRTGCRSATFSC